MNKQTAFIFIMLAPVLAFSEIISNKTVTGQARLYEKIEWSVQLKEKFENPYWSNEIALDLELTSPSGKNLAQPCYFLKGKSGKVSEWVARFAPREIGAYSYRFIVRRDGKVTAESAEQYISVKSSDKKGFLKPNDDWTFRYDNGELFRGIGENICWEARSNDDSKFFKKLHEMPKYNFPNMLGQLAENGGNYFRVWMCSWSLPLEWKKVSRNTDKYKDTQAYFNDGGIRKMDELVELCDSLGLHMMLAIDQSGNYREWGIGNTNYHKKQGGPIETALEFFSHPKAREQYKNRLRYLIARWGYSPSIGAWEFFNEIDYLAYDDNTAKPEMHQPIVDWHSEMAAYVKATDPYKHLVTTSISHRTIEGLNDIADIDFNQQHIYKHTSKMPAVLREYSKKHNKPYVIGEFGYEWDWSKNFDDFAEGMDSDYKKGLWLGMFSPTPILPLSWWWEYFENRGLFPYFKNVREVHNLMMQAGEGQFKPFEVTVENNKDTEAYGMLCGRTAFVYLHNNGKVKNGCTLKLNSEICTQGSLQLFDCESGEYRMLPNVKTIKKSCELKNVTLKSGDDLILVFSIGNAL